MKKFAMVLIIMSLLCVAAVALAVTAAPGQTVTVPINLTTSGAWCSVGISYDSSVLTFVSASGGNVAPQSGSGRFIFGSGTSPIGSASGSVTFRVSDSAAPGTYNVSAYKVECYDTAYNDVGASVSGGSVTVTGSATATPAPVNPYTASPTAYVPGATSTPKPSSTKKVTAVPVQDQGIYNYIAVDEDGNVTTQKAEMFVWGLALCEVKIDGVKAEIPTLGLELSANVKADQQLAVIYAPNTGKASLRKSEKSSSDIIVKMDAGTIVPVKQVKGDYAEIVYNGRTGWVKTSSVKFHGACEAIGKAKISSNNGSNVKMYLNRDNDSWVITKLSNGTEVTVIKEYKEWYEIDWNGFHGFVYKQHVKMAE